MKRLYVFPEVDVINQFAVTAVQVADIIYSKCHVMPQQKYEVFLIHSSDWL